MNPVLNAETETRVAKLEHPCRKMVQTLLPFIAAGFGIYIADRLIDSEKLSQFKSVVRKLRKFQGDSCGDAGLGDTESSYDFLNTVPPILCLPIKLRCKIWSFLNIEELRILRLVCGRLQCDVDMMVGIHVILDSNSPCFQWVHHIAVQSCFVKSLDLSLKWEDVIAKPNLLKRMELSKDLSTSLDFLKSIITVFEQLEELSFHMKSEIEDGDGFSVNEIENYLISLQNDKLDGLTVEFILKSWSLRWTAIFKKENIFSKTKKLWKPFGETFSKQLSHIFLNLPPISSEHRIFWIKLLNGQSNLKTLNLNLGDVNWLTYKNIVETNAKGLKKIFLSQIGSKMMDIKSKTTLQAEQPFDFAIFQNCQNLQVLGVSCESIVSGSQINGHCLPTNIVNLEKFPHQDLEGLLFAFLNFNKTDMELLNSATWSPNINRSILLNCSVDKICMPTIFLKKNKIDTDFQGYYPLLGESLDEKYDPTCYHEPDISVCCNLMELGRKTLSEASSAFEDWVTPVACLVWVAYC